MSITTGDRAGAAQEAVSALPVAAGVLSQVAHYWFDGVSLRELFPSVQYDGRLL